MTGPYDTPDHHVFIYGQTTADGWACRKAGCEWQHTGATTWTADQARELHDLELGLIAYVEVMRHTYPEGLYRDFVTGKHYTASTPRTTLDLRVAEREVTVVERRWLGRHPRAAIEHIRAGERITSTTIDTEYGNWRKA